MTPGLRKFALTGHVTFSVGLLGAVATFLVLALIGLTHQDAQIVRAAYLAMELVAWIVIVPLAFASLLTGAVQALGTSWGLFRHYWVLGKLLLTVIATLVLLVQMEPIGLLASAAAQTTLPSDAGGLQMRLLIHATGGLLVLLAATTLAVYKPWGLTRWARDRRE